MDRKTTLGLLTGISMFAFAGAASAGDVLTPAQMDGVTAAGGVFFDIFIDKDVDIDKTVDVDIDKDVDVTVDVTGNLAEAEASADCFGDNCLAETEAFAQATDFSAEAFSEATAAVD